MGTSTPSVSAQIADVQRLIEKSGVKYTMHSAGTTLGMYSVQNAGCSSLMIYLQRDPGIKSIGLSDRPILCSTNREY